VHLPLRIGYDFEYAALDPIISDLSDFETEPALPCCVLEEPDEIGYVKDPGASFPRAGGLSHVPILRLEP
jgi:hypothetical protein